MFPGFSASSVAFSVSNVKWFSQGQDGSPGIPGLRGKRGDQVRHFEPFYLHQSFNWECCPIDWARSSLAAWRQRVFLKFANSRMRSLFHIGYSAGSLGEQHLHRYFLAWSAVKLKSDLILSLSKSFTCLSWSPTLSFRDVVLWVTQRSNVGHA